MVNINKDKDNLNFIGINLNKNWNIQRCLKKIYGIGNYYSNLICNLYNIKNKKLKEINEKEQLNIMNFLKKIKIGKYLKRYIYLNIEKLIKIKCYRGIRHLKKLPVRGQNTRNNAKTRKKYHV
ncbi:ribosomal protein uS13 [Candidatus Vidania fulgoroideorum]